ncbi:hypothetical protein Tco_0011709 [Tanacetum coccineum]
MTHHYQWRWLWAKEGTSVDVAASDGMVKGGRGLEKEQKLYEGKRKELANTSMEYNPLYDADKGFNVMPSSFNDVRWMFGFDIGTSDYFALDVLLTASLGIDGSECLGIQQVVFGGQSMGDWEEGMKNPEDGYKSFNI